jgi:hypothetical protein
MTHAFQALSANYGPTARNYVLTVLAKQIAFTLESKGFSRKATNSDTNGAPKTEEAPVFDESLDCLVPMMDGIEKPKQFDVATYCEIYGACLVLAADAVKQPLEWGRTPDPEKFSAYFSQPGHWLASKVNYWKPRLEKEEAQVGATYGATTVIIQQRAAKKVAEYQDWASGVAKQMAAMIKLQSKQLQQSDAADIVEFIEERCSDAGFDLDKEVRFAGKAFMASRKTRYAAGEKLSAPQPGLLKLFGDLGVMQA